MPVAPGLGLAGGGAIGLVRARGMSVHFCLTTCAISDQEVIPKEHGPSREREAGVRAFTPVHGVTRTGEVTCVSDVWGSESSGT